MENMFLMGMTKKNCIENVVIHNLHICSPSKKIPNKMQKIAIRVFFSFFEPFSRWHIFAKRKQQENLSELQLAPLNFSMKIVNSELSYKCSSRQKILFFVFWEISQFFVYSIKKTSGGKKLSGKMRKNFTFSFFPQL